MARVTPNSHVSNPSVTRWLHELRQGDEFAAKRLWEFLHKRLLLLARKEVNRGSPTAYDEEDVALSAFSALCHSIQQGSYGEISDRGELWQLLAVIALNKARNKARDENRLRRGGGVSRIQMTNDLLENVASASVDPALATLMQDECQRLLGKLQKREVQMVALLKMEGYTNEEVAQQLGCTRRSVHRRLNLIREIWAEEVK